MRAFRIAAIAISAIITVSSLSACNPSTVNIAASYFRGIPNGQGIAACIIRRESGGNPNAISQTHDYGLYQINRKAHKKSFEAMFGRPFETKALNPTLNAKYARHLYDQVGWSPWKGGSYPCF